MTIGEIAMHYLTKLEWYSTLFPRIPVPIQKQIEQYLLARKATRIMAASARVGAALPDRDSRAPSYSDGDRSGGGAGRQDERCAGLVVSNRSRFILDTTVFHVVS